MKKRIYVIRFFHSIIIFLIHGFWDALISLVGYFADSPKISNADMIGGILLTITILFGIIYLIASLIQIIKVFKNHKNRIKEGKNGNE